MRQVLKYVNWSWLYFYAYIAVARVVLLNLVTAIIVENALAASRNDEVGKEIPRIIELHIPCSFL